MALTRLATRGDLSQLRWARWQSARSFDAHPLNAYGPKRPEKMEGVRIWDPETLLHPTSVDLSINWPGQDG